jgi:hypothetical protein
MATSLLNPAQLRAAERLQAMGPDRRAAAFLSGDLRDGHELHVWAALWPDEVPLVNGELPWIVATLADLD